MFLVAFQKCCVSLFHRSESVYKMPSEQENAGGPTVTPVYSPPRQKSQVQARRGRLGTNSSLTELIVDHDEEVQVVLSPPQHNEKHSSSKWTKPLSPKESDGMGKLSNSIIRPCSHLVPKH